MQSQYLYRALRPDEFEDGFRIIPKGDAEFEDHPRVGIGLRLPFKLAPSSRNAVKHHQWNQAGFPTRGISTTPHLHRARFYAERHKVIVSFDRVSLREAGITEYDVNELLRSHPQDIAVFEDEEVILVNPKPGPWIENHIHTVFRLNNAGEVVEVAI